MASVHKDPNGRSPFWYCSYLGGDGRWHFKSSKRRNEKEAREICRAWEKAGRLARNGRLTPDAARDVITRGVQDVMLQSGQSMPSFSVQAWFSRWLETKELEAEASTVERYRVVVERFLLMLGEEKAARNLEGLYPADLVALRDRMARELSKATANMFSKVVKTALGAAVRQGVLTSNPAAALSKLKGAGDAKRRPFTLAEIKRLLEQADQATNTEWRGMILCGLYLGGRLGDLASLQWSAVDLSKRTVAFTTEKTHRRMLLPLARPLVDYFINLPSSDDPAAFIFPKCAALGEKASGTLSNQFHKLMADTGLVTERKHTNRKHVEAEKGEGRRCKREVSPISFHSLRHSFVTMLKATGATDAIARELAGHESEAVSRLYTHLEADALRGAVEALPDVTRKRRRK